MLKITSKKKEYYDSQMSAKYVEFMECNEVQAEDVVQNITESDTQVIEAVCVGPDLFCDSDGVVITSRWNQQGTTLLLNEEACKEINKCAYSGDSRSPIPMISVHSVGDLLYRRQS